MEDDEFEWGEDKAARNLRKHHIRFEDALPAFRDPFAIEFEDDRFDYGEPRYILIGMVEPDVLVVVHTERNDRIRIISARKAEPNERRWYYESNT